MTAEPPVINPAPESRASESSASEGRPAAQPGPVTSISDPRVIQILSTEHWSLLASRSLAYNEAFIRGGMFLSFLSMSFVGLALLAQALSFDDQFLILASVVLAFDFVIGLLTYIRMAGAGGDDLRTVHGMARIRHAYTEIAPMVEPYFTTASHDDIASVLTAYGPPSTSAIGDVLYGLSTSLGMIGLITAMVGGVLTSVVSLLVGVDGAVAVVVGMVTTVITLLVMIAFTFRAVTRHQATLTARFPAPATKVDDKPPAAE
jgi:hypothetical protein